MDDPATTAPTAHLATDAAADALLPAADIVELPAERLDRLMGWDLAYGVVLVADWLTRNARQKDMPSERIALLCDKLLTLGLPLDRYGSSTEVLDAEHDSVSRLWVRGRGVTTRTYVRNGDDDSGYLASPFYEAARTGRAVEMHLAETNPSRFGIVEELQRDGFTHYLCVPIPLMNGGHGWVTFATRYPSGFTPRDVAAMARLLPAIAILIDLRSTWLSLDKLLRTYVGDEPHRAILRGNTKRGQVSTIRSAILFADMRDSIGRTADLDAVAAVGVFNALFDCLVPPIESRKGEVLKYMGDGLLAIFRDGQDGDAADRALAAGQDALNTLRARNLSHPEEPPIEAGVALHYGEAAYGNVGSGLRLDFTVIGKDVGLTSRIANLNRPLDQPVLMSRDFVARLHSATAPVGAFAVRGFKDLVTVFRPVSPDEAVAILPGADAA
ncbi:adenylate/guanylate cyclase domain-containing protein [Lichenibacterium ramalinae]|uniref:Adenylate/guanylate cyclase domain-containing protein n=1 Tax=Lichenibacterium ramalinae TaxID=2316527 RepID=A0A4V1RIY8_9HYPH|nr:adenylate/guanylate cyclase domain-containing protein [Lichenibacterium ramalinae]RYB06281.1 adenylate/guanylate cyclase domain-containing protein [Lichenibacterium ramalinae]